MRTRALWISLALFPFAQPALGEDVAEDPAALVRRARAAESIERDPAKAIALYRQVFNAAPGTDAARDALLRLLELYEARGEKPAAVEVANALTERYTTRLDDEGKRRVHEALARLLPAGSKARSPLGEVYVVPSGSGTSSPSSPLEAKVLAMLEKPAKGFTTEDVLRDLALVGRDAMPILERALRNEQLEKAQFAARALARIGGTGAVAVLAKAVREGDGFTRSAALRGLSEISAKPESSPTVVAAVVPLYEDPAFEDVRPSLRNLLLTHLSDERLLARHAAGGPDASAWLRSAVMRQNPEALKRIEAAAREGAPLDAPMIKAFVEAAGATHTGGSNAGPVLALKQPALAEEVRLRMLLAVAAQKPSAQTVSAVVEIAGAATASGSAPVSETAAVAAWSHVLSSEDPTVRASGVGGLVTMAVPIPPPIAKDESKARAIVDSAERAQGANQLNTRSDYVRRLLTSEALRSNPGYWAAIAELVPRSRNQSGRFILNELARVATAEESPSSLLPTWLRLVRDEISRGGGDDPWAQWMTRTVARATDPAVLEIARTWNSIGQHDETYMRILRESYRGPGLSGLALERVEQQDRLNNETWTILLAERDSGEIWTEFAEVAQTGSAGRLKAMYIAVSNGPRWNAPASFGPAWVAALRRTDAPEQHEIWATIARWAAESGEPGFVAVARARIEKSSGIDWSLQHTPELALARALADSYEGPDRLDTMRALVRSTGIHVEVAKPLIDGLGEAGDAATIVDVARHPELPAAPAAIGWLASNGRQADLGAIIKAAIAAPLPSEDYTEALVSAAYGTNLADAIPWLLRLVKEGHPEAEDAANTIDRIHAHHARIAKFESYRAPAVDPRQAIEAHLSDADPVIRRAAVIALAAAADREALPRLLTIAKEEKDATVRTAALDAIERISKSPPRVPTPVPEAPAME
jgi:HEAT repeat protein